MQPGALSLEPLEPRVLLSADPAGVQPVLTCETVSSDQAIHVDLNDQAPEKQQGLPPVLTLEVLPGAGTSQPKTEDETLSTPELEPAGQPAVELFRASPALFVENQGQWSDSSIRYVHDGNGVDVAVTDMGVVFRAADTDLQLLQFSASFVGASAVRPVGREQSASLFNYYVGDPAHWRQSVPSYERVAYEGLYEGIDLRIQGLRSHIKYEFHVAPGADYRRIAVRYEGIEGLSLGEDGSLQVNLGAGRGVIRDDAPYVYQEIGGQKMTVAGRFVLLDDRTYSFEITGPIDPVHALVIDPDLVWSTYLGGGDSDSAYGVAVDTSGNIYVTGETSSPDWTSGGFDPTHNNGYDAFVAKLSPDGTHVWSTYVGGGNDDSGQSIAVDSLGNVYVTGTTMSPGWTSGGFDPTFSGSCDAFVAKLNSGGAHVWSTFLGGDASDWGYGIAVDSGGNVCVTGYTNSSGWTSGGFDPNYDNGYDAFVAKLSPGGDHLWSTYLGGVVDDAGFSIAVDSGGSVYVTGYTNSSGWASGGFDPTHNNAYDGFVAKLSSDGAHLWSTYLGGSDYDLGYGIAVSPSGSVYVTGNTKSSGWTSGGFDVTYNGGDVDGDAFVVKLSSGGAHLWSTYLGGSSDEFGRGITVDTGGNAYVIGDTGSSGWTSGGFDITHHGGTDAFVARLSSSGAHLWSAYLGGSDNDGGYAIVAGSSGRVYGTGITCSSGWTGGGFDPTYNGGPRDAFVASINDPDTIPPTIGSFSVSPTSVEWGGSFTIAYTVSDSGGLGLNRVELWRTNNPDSWPAQAVATNSALEDGPVSGSFSDVPPLGGDWWYGIHVFDTAGNSITETQGGGQPIHVVMGSPPGNEPPGQPSCISPVPGATVVSLTLTLESSDFLDPNAGDIHAASQWQVDDSSDFSSVVWDYEDTDSDKTGQAVPSATLLYSTTYYWRVRYQDGQGAWSEWSASGSFTTASTGSEPSPVFRFYSPAYSTHFYTMDTAERNDLIDNHADLWTYEGIAYYAFTDNSQPAAVPVYRFCSASRDKYFYTVNESERDKLINLYSNVWTYEGVAFYVLPSYAETSGTSPVYRLWSSARQSHFWTISAVERDRFVASSDWTYEGAAWYAVRGAPLVAVDWQRRPDASPQVTGTVDDAAATIGVAVGGQTYAAVNDGDGTWTLPNDQIAPGLADGIYDVAARAADPSGRIGTDMTTNELTIDTAVPVVAAGADQSVDEGRTVSLIGASFSDASPINTHTAMIDWGDGSSPAAEVVDQVAHTIDSSHVYADNGTFTITIIVTDDDGLSGNDTCTATVSNVAPTVQAGDDRTITQGWPIYLAPAGYNDPGTLDTHTATIDWGDGAPPDSGESTETPFGPPGDISGMDGTVDGSHIYTSPGIYAVVVAVVDDDGGLGQDTFVVTVQEDIDADGIASTEEQGPAGQDASYDGNADGTPDAQQNNVASFHTVTDDYVTLGCSPGMSLSDVAAVANPSPGNIPQAVQVLYGSFAFRVNGVSPGSSATVTLFLPVAATANAYYKYGPTPDNPNAHWYAFMYNGQTGAQISGNVVALHFVDGLRGDDDLSANGAIVDSGGPAVVGQPGCAPVYRFWKASDNTHFFTIKESEKDKLIRDFSNIYTYEGPACYAFPAGQQPEGALPVYRFWKPSDNTHFYTIKESEKDKLIRDYPLIYTYEGPAYYAFLAGQQPVGAVPVYRFWKASDNTHFYTTKASERDKLISLFSDIFTFENIVWYAYTL